MKNSKAISDILSVILANFISIAISILVVLIIPKFVTIEQYGYWQLYIFYSSYVGFMHLGHIDGVYLKLGGANYNSINKPLYKQQFMQLSFSQILVGLIIGIAGYFTVHDSMKFYVISMTLVNLVLVNVKMYFQFILQSTSMIKRYSQSFILERIIYLVLIILTILILPIKIEFLIICDLISKFISLLFVCYICKEIITAKKYDKLTDFKEFIDNIKVGINLMLANIASILIIGIIRFTIEHSHGISDFAKVSLTLSIANFMMIFITAVGIVIYPLLRRMNSENYVGFYNSLRTILTMIISLALVLYFPIKTFLSDLLPKYSESLIYAGLLFPMILFESKTLLLVSSFLKNFRKEKQLLKLNIIALIISLIFTTILYFTNSKIEYFVISIPILLFIRSFIGELYVNKIININLLKENLYTFVIATSFITIVLKCETMTGIFLYMIIWMIFSVINFKKLINSIKFLKNINN